MQNEANATDAAASLAACSAGRRALAWSCRQGRAGGFLPNEASACAQGRDPSRKPIRQPIPTSSRRSGSLCMPRQRGSRQSVPAPCVSVAARPCRRPGLFLPNEAKKPSWKPNRPPLPAEPDPSAKTDLSHKGCRHLAECGPSRRTAAAPEGRGIDRNSPDLCPMAAPVHAPSPSITAITPT